MFNLADVLQGWFWVALLQIIGVNIILSGDNAVVIALAARSLPQRQQKLAIILGSIGAIVLRVILTFFAAVLLTLPYLKIIGGLLLLWIGVQLLEPEDDEGGVEAKDNLIAAVRTILMADLIMSLDNVLGVAAAAKGNLLLLILGLGISIPLIIYGSQLILKLFERFPIIITAGAGLLGWVAGEMLIEDPTIAPWIKEHAHILEWIGPAAGVLFVIGVGTWLGRRHAAEAPVVEVDHKVS